jgi:hypothetical protein
MRQVIRRYEGVEAAEDFVALHHAVHIEFGRT